MNHSSKLPSWLALPGLCFRAIVLSLALAATTAVAQRADDDPDDDDVLVLNPFIISESEDVGYIATNSTAGTSLNMLIRDIPLSLEVINREMIDDMQATTLEESLIYSAGVFTDNYRAEGTANPAFADNSPSTVGNYADPFQNLVSIRGYTVPNQQRAGFRVGFLHNVARIVIGGSTDTITTERQEVVRGPQSLLYGINVMSGVTNIEPKRPLGDFFASTSLMVGNFNEFRATFDVTDAVIPGKLNYRVMGATHSFDDKDDINFREHERETIGVQFDWIITPRTTLFLEYIYANRESRGIGPTRFSTSELVDRYGEAFHFGEDDPTFHIWAPGTGVVDDWYEQDHDLSFLGFSGADGVQDGPLVKNPAHADFYGDWDKGRSFNVSGPDTFRKQKESNILAQLYHSFSDNFNMELGYYHSEVQIQERNMVLGTLWNGDPTSDISPMPPGRSRTWHNWYQMPEVNEEVARNDWFSNDLGEMFLFDDVRTVNPVMTWYQYVFVPPPTAEYAYRSETGLPPGSVPMAPDRVYGYYYWYEKPGRSESNQFRVRLAYDLETDFLGGEEHTFVVGGSLIQDEINFVSGNGSLRQFYSDAPGTNLSTSPYRGKVAIDPIMFRRSVFDTTPIRLQPDDVIARAGNISVQNLGRLRESDTGTGIFTSDIARSGFREDKLWFRGAYAIYRGRFWDDRVTLIGGIRHDSYQGREAEQLLVLDRDGTHPDWLGHGNIRHVPNHYIGYGDKPWTYDSYLNDKLNAGVARSLEILQETHPNGTVDYLFPESQTFNTKSGGLTVKIIEPLSVYVAYAEGIFPNVGQRDGAYNPIDAEQSESREIGIKFELLDKKISGTISFWQIDRTNAVTTWNYAPHPAGYYGNPAAPATTGDQFVFSPLNTHPETTFMREGVSTFPSGYLDRNNSDDVARASPYRAGNYLPVNYGIDIRYVERAMYDLGYASPDYSDGVSFEDFAQFSPNGEIIDTGSASQRISGPNGGRSVQMLMVDYNKALKGADPETSVLKRAFELAMNNADVFGPPTDLKNIYGEGEASLVPYEGFGIIHYDFGADGAPLNNPSTKNFNVGVPVTFDEEGEGIDGQLIFAPTQNWQLIFNFSHQERSVTQLNLVDAMGLDPNGNMINYGTEYDVWVYLLRPENFEDPTRASTYKGDSVRGLDLSYVPQDSAGVITRYTFSEGILDGLMIGGGTRYESKVKTATTIGGARLQENHYLPPDRPERWVFNVFARYGWEMWDIDWRLQLNIDNLFDHKEDIVVASYVNELYDTPVERRTRVYYQPRTWRVSLSAQF